MTTRRLPGWGYDDQFDASVPGRGTIGARPAAAEALRSAADAQRAASEGLRATALALLATRQLGARTCGWGTAWLIRLTCAEWRWLFLR
jgi:hypothetical protein